MSRRTLVTRRRHGMYLLDKPGVRDADWFATGSKVFAFVIVALAAAYVVGRAIYQVWETMR